MSEVHGRARTTPLIRAEIRSAQGTQRELAERFNVTVATVRKWQNRDQVQDRSHRPHQLSTTLTPGEEAVVVELRRTLLLPLDDLLVVTREFINKLASRSGIDRCLRRHGVANLGELQRASSGGAAPEVKTFKSYEPGFVHVDIKYLPQMPDESSRRYLFVAIDRATRWVHVRIYDDQSELSSAHFLASLMKAAPMKITKILTDNGSQFTDRFTTKGRVPSGKHLFDQRCTALGIEHRLSPPRHPQTNGMVERFNGRIAEVINQTRFASAHELETTLKLYTATYNHRIPQRAIGHLSPIQALKQWQKERPELFVKRVYEQPGLDSYSASSISRRSAITVMKIAVMGAGAVGCYYGGMLARGGHDVTLIGRGSHVDAIRREGLRLETTAFDVRIPMSASTEPADVAGARLVLFCVKSTDTLQAAAQIAPHLAADASVLSLQNGVDNAERLQALLPQPVRPVVVYVATEMAGPGHVRHHGRGDLVVGPSPEASKIVAAFAAGHVPVAVSDNVTGALWAKLIVNCAFNAISAVTQTPYGRMWASDGMQATMMAVVNECLAVANAAGIVVPGDSRAAVVRIAETMPGQYSSTAQDLARGKRSEIDHLNGHVVQLADSLGVPVPLNRALLALVKLTESRIQA